MTIINSKVINPEAPWSFITDTVEGIMADLEKYTLDPIFEHYGDFVNRHPTWTKPEYAEKYKGLTSIFGNFLNLSHALNIYTDDEELIGKLEAAILANKATPEYREARDRLQRRLEEEAARRAQA